MILVLVVFYAATASMSIFEWHPLLVLCFELVGLSTCLPVSCFSPSSWRPSLAFRVSHTSFFVFRFSLFPSLETRAVTRQRRKAKLLSNFLALIIMRKGVVKICPKIRMSRNRARRKVSDDGLLLMALRLRLEECKYV